MRAININMGNCPNSATISDNWLIKCRSGEILHIVPLTKSFVLQGSICGVSSRDTIQSVRMSIEATTLRFIITILDNNTNAMFDSVICKNLATGESTFAYNGLPVEIADVNVDNMLQLCSYKKW